LVSTIYSHYLFYLIPILLELWLKQHRLLIIISFHYLFSFFYLSNFIHFIKESYFIHTCFYYQVWFNMLLILKKVSTLSLNF
jgi:hypothetical protein